MAKKTKPAAIFAAPNYQQAELLPPPAPITPEQITAATHEAVVKLRRAGFAVNRVGRQQHRVGNRLVTTRELVELARHAN